MFNIFNDIWRKLPPVIVATTCNINRLTDLCEGCIIDDVTLKAGDRILVKDQDDARENGIYIAPTRMTMITTDHTEPSTPPLSYASDLSWNAKFEPMCVNVNHGTIHGGQQFYLQDKEDTSSDDDDDDEDEYVGRDPMIWKLTPKMDEPRQLTLEETLVDSNNVVYQYTDEALEAMKPQPPTLQPQELRDTIDYLIKQRRQYTYWSNDKFRQSLYHHEGQYKREIQLMQQNYPSILTRVTSHPLDPSDLEKILRGIETIERGLSFDGQRQHLKREAAEVFFSLMHKS
jgi:hypothetical protein